MAKENIMFLLGGKDLEMEEIKKMLTENDIRFIDRNLSWGADLSAYSDDIKNLASGTTIYGIELGDSDNLAPDNYVRIDHHNDYADREAAIKQVADIIGIELNRDQQLVAANDSGYIPAMQAMGATPEEIADIRRRDRAAQGVTEEEERMADQAIRETSTRNETSFSVRVPNELNHFSPITDAEFGTKHITVYNDNELCYYGPLAHTLGKEYAKDVEEGRMYFGGAEASGFFGTSSGKVSRIGIMQLVQEIDERIQDVNLPEDVIRTLASDTDSNIRTVIAERKSLPEDLVRTLAVDKDSDVRAVIASREDLSEDLVRILANDEDKTVRAIIAMRKDIPEDFLRTLANDKNEWVRTVIAYNEDIPEDMVHTLATDENKDVRKAIANREDLPEDLIRTLATDKDWQVREAIAERKSLPEDLVRTLAVDEDSDVRKAIAKREDLPEDVIRTLNPNFELEKKVFDLLSKLPDKRLVLDRPLFVYSNPDPFDLSKMFANEIYIGTDYHCEKFTEVHGKTTWGNELTNDDVAVRFINHRNQEKYDEMMEEIGWVTTGNDAIIAEEMGLDPYNQEWPDGVGDKLFSDKYSQKGYEYNREILAKTVLKRIYAEKARIKYEAEEKKNRELAKIFEKEHTGYVADESIKELFLVMREDYKWISDMECHSLSLHHFKTLKEATEYFNKGLSEKNPDGRKIQGTEADFTNGLVIKSGGCNAMSLIKINREATRTMEKDSSEFWNISPYESGGDKRKDALLKKYESGLPFTDKEITEIRRSIFHEEPKVRTENIVKKNPSDCQPAPRLVTRGGKYNYDCGNGKVLCSVWLDNAEPFRNGRARCIVGSTQFEIDTKGIILKKEALKNGISKGIR